MFIRCQKALSVYHTESLTQTVGQIFTDNLTLFHMTNQCRLRTGKMNGRIEHSAVEIMIGDRFAGNKPKSGKIQRCRAPRRQRKYSKKGVIDIEHVFAPDQTDRFNMFSPPSLNLN